MFKVGDKVTIQGTVTGAHGDPSIIDPRMCVVFVRIPGGQALQVNVAAVAPAPAPEPEPKAVEQKPRRGKHEKKVVAQAEVETPEAEAEPVETPEG